MTSLIAFDCKTKIENFNLEGEHYNIVANEIYRVRRENPNPFSEFYLPYIVAGLAIFDMGRMLGYSSVNGNFVVRLKKKLESIRPWLEPLVSADILSADLEMHTDRIRQSYEVLSTNGPGALHQDQTKSFFVGASKILHFLNPELFILLDRYAARAFRVAHGIPFRNTTQPGYSPSRYFECVRLAQKDILNYGADNFKAMEPTTPITRIYDKLTFMTGSERI